MNRIVLIISLAFFLSLFFSGQAAAQRYLPGQRGLQLTASAVDGFHPGGGDKQGFAFDIGMATYNQSGDRWVLSGGYLQKKRDYAGQSIPVCQFTGELGYYKKFLSDHSKTVFFSAGASAMAGYETINWGESLLDDGATLMNKDRFLYGGAIGLEIETFITDRLVLLVSARERILYGSTVSKFRFQTGIGIKYIIN